MYKYLIIILLFVSAQSYSNGGQSQNGVKIFPSQDIDSFADSVSISGNRALVGATSAGPVNGAGAAYIFEYDGTSWNETKILIASDFDFGDAFGSSVSLLGDRAVISAISDNNERGSVYVFDFNGTDWIETAKITSTDSLDEDKFGFSISLATDKLLIGAPFHDKGTGPFDMDTGAAYLYDFTNNSWQLNVKLTPMVDVAASFGNAVSLSNNRAVIGAFNDGLFSGSPGGSVFVFNYNGSGWVEDDKLKPSDVEDTSGFFGHSVSHSGDKVIIGDYIRTRAYIFEKQNNLWVEDEIIIQGNNTFFGYSVAISGNKAVIGEPNKNNLTGSVYMYQPNGDSWVQSLEFSAPDGMQSDLFGFTLSFDGANALIGAPGGNSNDNNRPDAAYIFSFDLIFKNGFEFISN